MPAQPAKALRPFRYSTRQRMQQVTTIPIAIGNQTTVDMPRVGFISGILLSFNSTMTLSSAGVFGPEGPFGFIKRITVDMNTGASQIFNCSGFGAWIVNSRMIRSAFFPGNNDLSAAPSASGANNVYYSLYVPIAMNDQLQFENGLINLQAPEVRLSLNVTFASSGGDVVTNFTSVTGNVNVSYVYYELPNPNTTTYPPLALHRILQERNSVTATGDQVYTFPRGGSVMQVCQIVTLNNELSTLQQGLSTSNRIDSVRVVLNKTDTPYQVPARNQALWQAMNQAGQNEVGQCIDWNWYDAGSTRTGEGDSRDWMNSDMISTLEFITTINSGAVVGANAWIDTIRRIYQPLQG